MRSLKLDGTQCFSLSSKSTGSPSQGLWIESPVTVSFTLISIASSHQTCLHYITFIYILTLVLLSFQLWQQKYSPRAALLRLLPLCRHYYRCLAIQYYNKSLQRPEFTPPQCLRLQHPEFTPPQCLRLQCPEFTPPQCLRLWRLQFTPPQCLRLNHLPKG